VLFIIQFALHKRFSLEGCYAIIYMFINEIE
jgi:2-oxoglutarate dehydrogenase complex dehydrogenase (E1) component-like enzyme